jgi:hypothetical protein
MHINSKRLLEQVPSVDLKILDAQYRQIQSLAVTISELTEDLVRGKGFATDITQRFHWAINDFTSVRLIS